MKRKGQISILSIITILFLLNGCSNNISFNELQDYQLPKNQLKSHSSLEMGYTVLLPHYMKLVEKEYSDTIGYELYIDTNIVFEEGSNTLSILKYDSLDSSLESLWKEMKSNKVLIEDFKVLSEGKTNHLSQPSYYQHSTYTINDKTTESISFLIQGDLSNFYLLEIQVNTEENYPNNLKDLLFSVKSLEGL